MNAPIPPLKHLQTKQYLSWLRRATDPEWDEERFGCGSRSKTERAAAAFALELSEAFECIAALAQERDQMQSKLALLTDPAAVHANILRGTLPLTKAQAIHIAGLPADVEQEMERLRAEVERLSAVLKSIHCASCGGNNLKHKRGCEQAILARRKP